MGGELFKKKEASVVLFHSSVPAAIKVNYEKMLSEMPRDLYQSVINNYHRRGGTIEVAEKIRMLDPTHNPFHVGYTSKSRPAQIHLQYTGRGDSQDVRPYNDLKRNLNHEVGHAVFSSYAQEQARTGRNFRQEFTTTYMSELSALGHPRVKPVDDYFLPGGLKTNADAAKEAFCEILSHQTNGGIHSFNRPDAKSVNPNRDFPRSSALVREATQGFIAKNLGAVNEVGQELRDPATLDVTPQQIPPKAEPPSP